MPVFVRGDGNAILGLDGEPSQGDDLVMFIKVEFELEESKLTGNVVLVVDVDSARRFAELVDAYVTRVVG